MEIRGLSLFLSARVGFPVSAATGLWQAAGEWPGVRAGPWGDVGRALSRHASTQAHEQRTLLLPTVTSELRSVPEPGCPAVSVSPYVTSTWRPN